MANGRMPSTKKAETHERILAHASRAIRRAGYDGVSVAELMKEAGLTHGGFYAHFESRDALVVEAMERATSDSLQRLAAAADAAPAGEELDVLVEQYLSDAHAKKPEGGCALAALGSETRRQAPAVRAITARQARAFASLVERMLPDDGTSSRADRARFVVSALVGGLIIARAVDNAELSRAFRSSVKRGIAEDERGRGAARGEDKRGRGAARGEDER